MRYDVILVEVFPDYEKPVFKEFQIVTSFNNWDMPGETWNRFHSRPCVVFEGLRRAYAEEAKRRLERPRFFPFPKSIIRSRKRRGRYDPLDNLINWKQPADDEKCCNVEIRQSTTSVEIPDSHPLACYEGYSLDPVTLQPMPRPEDD